MYLYSLMSYGRQLLLGPARSMKALPPGYMPAGPQRYPTAADPTVMQKLQMMLGNLGSRIEGIDRAYADAIYNRIGGQGNNRPFVEATATAPVMDILKQDAGRDPYLMLQKYGGAAANVASRYALPAGGVTLAGKGLLDIASALGGSDEDERGIGG